MRHFDRIIVKKNPGSISMMMKFSQNRLEHWTSRLGNVLPLLYILKDRTTGILRNLEGYKSPITFNQMLQQSNENIYQYNPPSKGAVIDIFGPGTVFYYIRNQYNLREKNRKHNLERKSRRNISRSCHSLTSRNPSTLRRPHDKLQSRTEVFSKEIGCGAYYDNNTKELEDRIEKFLKILNSNKPVFVEPLSDILVTICFYL